MQMFPDDLPLANIDADGYCYHFMRSFVRPWAWVCVLHTKRLEEMAYNLACWCIQMAYTQHSWMLMDIVVGPSVRLFVYGIFSKVRVGAKEGVSHYWEMAVAITCGYGGYLLPLLPAHSSYILIIFFSIYDAGWISDVKKAPNVHMGKCLDICSRDICHFNHQFHHSEFWWLKTLIFLRNKVLTANTYVLKFIDIYKTL